MKLKGQMDGKIKVVDHGKVVRYLSVPPPRGLVAAFGSRVVSGLVLPDCRYCASKILMLPSGVFCFYVIILQGKEYQYEQK